MDARQFDVFRTHAGPLVVVVRHHIHEAMRSRFVVPLVEMDRIERKPIDRLNPHMSISGPDYVVMFQSSATLMLTDLHRFVTSLTDRRDDLMRAIDILVTGV